MNYAFIMYVYQIKDNDKFINSIQVELIDDDFKSAQKRALEIAGNETRNKVHITKIVEIK